MKSPWFKLKYNRGIAIPYSLKNKYNTYENQVTTISKQNALPKSPRLPLLRVIFPEQKMFGTCWAIIGNRKQWNKIAISNVYLFRCPLLWKCAIALFQIFSKIIKVGIHHTNICLWVNKFNRLNYLIDCLNSNKSII
jgi:hypothetical protein